MATQNLSAADGFVLAMLGMMAVSLGVLVVLLLCMRRNVARRDHEVDELLEEVAETERTEKQGITEEAKPPELWEKDGDWWKK